MVAIQTTDEIQALLNRVEGQEILSLQVLGINSLKSMSPMPDALVGEIIAFTSIQDRHVLIATADYRVIFDLQRTGKLVWLNRASPYVMTPGSSRPTVRLILASGEGLDLTELAKTKRIAVTILPRT